MNICKVFLNGDPEPMYVTHPADLLVALVVDSEPGNMPDFLTLPIFDTVETSRSAYVRPGRISAIVPTTQTERDQILEAAEAE